MLLDFPIKNHPQKKHIVLDGKLRSKWHPTDPVSLFFCVGRTQDVKEANLILDFIKLKANVECATVSGKRKAFTSILEGDALPKVLIKTIMALIVFRFDKIR